MRISGWTVGLLVGYGQRILSLGVPKISNSDKVTLTTMSFFSYSLDPHPTLLVCEEPFVKVISTSRMYSVLFS